jgi:nucleotide-binding universal stress UspA family protein
MSILCASPSTLAVASLWCRAARDELLEVQPDADEIVRRAQEANATLVVLDGAAPGALRESLAQALRAPLLVVRDSSALEGWLDRARPLALAVAYEASPTGDAALAWAAGLARLAPVALVALHSYGIHEQREKRGLSGPLPIGTSDARIEAPLAGELRTHIAGLALGCEPRLVLRGCLGRPAEHLVQMAAEAEAELLVVGNHHRRKLERAWKGSVSRGVIELAQCSVACISVREPG